MLKDLPRWIIEIPDLLDILIEYSDDNEVSVKSPDVDTIEVLNARKK